MNTRSRLGRRLMICGLTAVFALGFVFPVRAQTMTNAFSGLSESSDEPIDIESDALVIYPEDHATFSGNVKAVQGTTTLRAREIKVNYVGGAMGTGGEEQAETGTQTAGTEDSGDAAATGDGGEEQAGETEASEAESAQVSEDPINIVSDYLLVNDKEKYAQFKGNVKFKQGATRLRARELKVSYAGSDNLSVAAQMEGGGGTQITKMEAKGEVRALFLPTGSAETETADAAPGQTPQGAAPAGGEVGLASAAGATGASGGAQGAVQGAVQGAASQTQAAQTPAASEAPEPDDDKGVTKIEATGDVVITSKKDETTTSDWLIYDLPLQLVTIGGNVVLTQNDNVLRGDRLAIDLQSGETRLENIGGGASAGGGRIRALFMPKDGPGPGGATDKNDRGRGAAVPPAPQPLGGAAVESATPPAPQMR